MAIPGEAMELAKLERAGWFECGWKAALAAGVEQVRESPSKDADFSEDLAEAREAGWAGDEVAAVDNARAGWDAARREMLREDDAENIATAVAELRKRSEGRIDLIWRLGDPETVSGVNGAVYRAPETATWWGVSREELIDLGWCLRRGDEGDVYSQWCTRGGEELGRERSR